jgi:Fe-S cluster assembly protein SufD
MVTLQEGKNELVLTPDLRITTQKGVQSFLVLRIHEAMKTTLQVSVAHDSQLTLFCLNQSLDLDLDEVYTLENDAKLELAYGDFSIGKAVRSVTVNLEGTGSEITLNSAALVSQDSVISYRFNHRNRHTSGQMNNFAVLSAGGSMTLKAIGHIEANAGTSETHQTTRVLNLKGSKKATVFPYLIIDNNDVQASHAESTGQMDDDHLYYLQSRGLSADQAIRLLVKGYLSSVTDSIQDDDLKALILDEIDRKVDAIC